MREEDEQEIVTLFGLLFLFFLTLKWIQEEEEEEEDAFPPINPAAVAIIETKQEQRVCMCM